VGKSPDACGYNAAHATLDALWSPVTTVISRLDDILEFPAIDVYAYYGPLVRDGFSDL